MAATIWAGPPAGPWDASVLSVAAVAERLDTDPGLGLSAAEAEARLARYGPNTLREPVPVPIWRRFLAQFADPLVYLLLAAVAVSAVVWAAEGAHGVPVDVVVIAAVILVNAVIGLVQEQRAESAVAALARLTEATASVVRDGVTQQIPAAAVVAGDVLLLREGDAVPADGRCVSSHGLRVLESALTGESESVAKAAPTLPEVAALGDRENLVFRGTAVTQGSGRALVTHTGMATQVGAIAELLERTESEPSPLQRDIARVSRWLGITVLVIAVVVMAVTALTFGVHSLNEAVTVLFLGVSLAVAAVPEGLLAILSVVLAIGVQRMAALGAVVKRLHSVETLGCATVIASDKTGTLTRNEMTVQRVVTASGEVALTGTGYGLSGEPLPIRGSLDDPALVEEVELVLLGGCLANNATLVDTIEGVEVTGDPTEAAFLVAAHKIAGVAGRRSGFSRRGEIPFTSERKLMSWVGWQEQVARLGIITKGAPDVLLQRCTAVQYGGRRRSLTDAERRRVLAEIENLSEQAFRTIGVAYSWFAPEHHESVLDTLATEQADALEHDLVYLGTVGIIDPPRAEASAAIAQARGAGVRVLMITGDHPATASRVARDLGIHGAGDPATTGGDVDDNDAAWLAERARESSVFARVAPAHKLALVRALQADGQVVAMTGDGVNDAPALKAADIGIAMGRTGTEVSRQAADVVLADDNFATIVAAVREGRRIFDNIRKFLQYLLSSNLGEVFTVFFGVVLAAPLGLLAAGGNDLVVPLLATQILWINLVTDSGPALAMGVDPEVDDVMARPPRSRTTPVIDKAMWAATVRVGVVMSVATLVAMDAFLPGGLIAFDGSLTLARTAAFTTLVLAQLFNAFNSRSRTRSAFAAPFSNRWLWLAVGVAVVLQVAITEIPLLQTAFGTASLNTAQWLLCAGLASLVLWVEEARKLLARAQA